MKFNKVVIRCKNPEILALISLQRPVKRFARTSIIGFGLRAGALVGYKVRLRGKQLKFFFKRLLNLALFHNKSFRGIKSRLIQNNSLRLGFNNANCFNEVASIQKFQETKVGLQLRIVASNPSDLHIFFPISNEI